MDDRRRVHPAVDRTAAYAWRLVVIGAAAYAALWLVGRLLVVVLPLFVAVLLARAIAPVDGWLRERGLPRGAAAAAAVLGLLVVVVAALALVGTSIASEFDELGPTLTNGVDDVETWLVEDSPFDVDRADVERWRTQAGAALADLGGGTDAVASGAVVAAEVLVGAVLALIVTFFVLKDRERMSAAVLRAVRAERRDEVRRVAARAWAALGGYLRGAALLGVVEASVIGVTMAVVGARLVAPVMVLTLLGAFVPIVGAVAAGFVAVLVTLVTAGTTDALVVLVVAVLVQQFDNDLLAPVVYGRAVRLHPLTILLGIAAGSALFGLVGTFLAVPVLAVVLNVVDEVRGDGEADHGGADQPDAEPTRSSDGAISVRHTSQKPS